MDGLCMQRLGKQRIPHFPPEVSKIVGEYATKEPYAFLYIDLLRPSNEAFFKNFNVRLVPKESA